MFPQEQFLNGLVLIRHCFVPKKALYSGSASGCEEAISSQQIN
jgi:hypothetical protein